MVDAMGAALVDCGALGALKQVSRVFHYSKGPFEQVLDAAGYVYDADGDGLPLDQHGFLKYLLGAGLDREAIEDLVRGPIVECRAAGDGSIEDSIFQLTRRRSSISVST